MSGALGADKRRDPCPGSRAYDHGIGGYNSDQLRSRVLGVPIAITLRSLSRHRVGRRLRLTGTLGVHGFDTPGFEDVEVKAGGIIPGLELL